MYFLTEQLITHALDQFNTKDFSRRQDGDTFFETFCPGNTIYFSDRPHERFSDYEEFLKLLSKEDPNKYQKIHKGTPFYFLAWTSFDLKNYEKGVFYLDNAISEDKKNKPDNWWSAPGTCFVRLMSDSAGPASRVVLLLKAIFQRELNMFNSVSKEIIRPETITENLVHKLLSTDNGASRSIITAFYSFIFEFEDRYNELTIRSSLGGSLEPIFTHLFKGGLVFESLLKYFYPRFRNQTLSKIMNDQSFKTDFGFSRMDIAARSFEEILKLCKKNDKKSTFEITGKIRNTSGHNLIWDDIFSDPDSYKSLFEHEVCAILYVIKKHDKQEIKTSMLQL